MTALALIRRVCGSVAVLAFFLFSSSSFATISPSPIYGWSTNYAGFVGGTQWRTATEACQAAQHPNNTWTEPVLNSGTGYNLGAQYYCWSFSVMVQVTTIGSSCPVNSTGTTTCTCNSGYVENASHTACEAPAVCGAVHDSVQVVNLTAGFMRSPGGAVYPAFKPDGTPAPSGYLGLPPATICNSGCLGTVCKLVNSWSSHEPTATGLYRISDDWEVTYTDATCSSSPANEAVVSLTAPVPPCDGFLGYVDGKAKCVAKVPDSGFVGAKGSTIGNPKAGSLGGGERAGNIPSTGGNGANAGGPASGKDGSFHTADGAVIPKSPSSAPTGTTGAPPAGEEQQACGAPGQPVCAVKVDGTGMPDGKNVFTTDKLNEQSDALEAALTAAGSTADKNTSWGLVPRWLQSGACQPSVILTLPPNLGSRQITIDLCPHLPKIYLLMNLLWSVWTFAAVIGMVFRVTTTSQG